MNLSIIFSRAVCGVRAPEVVVETHLANGLPALSIVGLPEAAVRESKDRVRSALLNTQFEFPPRRITINLAPADLPKEGGRFDLPIAIGILAASGQLPDKTLERYEFVGELALSGAVRSVPGILPHAMAAKRSGRVLVLPRANLEDAALVRGLGLIVADSLLQLCALLRGQQPIPLASCPPTERLRAPKMADLRDVIGQHQAKRALEIAAAGGHNLLFLGPPGTGKTMLASRLPSLLPPMSDDEALQAAAVASVVGKAVGAGQLHQRPFRNPHHTASAVALVGGGSQPRPGEVSLAHNGVLFLDELPEFDRRVLEVLREPLESGSVTISRAARQECFPARFQLIAAMNPCPCGHYGSKHKPCRCSPDQIRRYLGKLSAPFVDRIDLHVEVPPLPRGQLSNPEGHSEPSAQVRERVCRAHRRQIERCNSTNARLSSEQMGIYCRLKPQHADFLDSAIERLGLSARAYHRILKVARTIADLADIEQIERQHLAEALQYRRLEKLQAQVC